MKLPNKHKGTVKATPEQECGGALLAHVLEGTEPMDTAQRPQVTDSSQSSLLS